MRPLPFLVVSWLAAVTLLCSRAQANPPLVPDAMLQACLERPVGAACSVSFGGKAKQGVCTELPDKALACMPPRGAGKKKSPAKPGK